MHRAQPIGVSASPGRQYDFLQRAVHRFFHRRRAENLRRLVEELVVDVDQALAHTPARDAAAYAGTYHNDYVGDLRIAADGGTLRLIVGPGDMTYDLQHFDGDTFTYLSAPEIPDYPSIVDFTIGPDGNATALQDSSFEGSHQDLLVRR